MKKFFFLILFLISFSAQARAGVFYDCVVSNANSDFSTYSSAFISPNYPVVIPLSPLTIYDVNNNNAMLFSSSPTIPIPASGNYLITFELEGVSLPSGTVLQLQLSSTTQEMSYTYTIPVFYDAATNTSLFSFDTSQIYSFTAGDSLSLELMFESNQKPFGYLSVADFQLYQLGGDSMTFHQYSSYAPGRIELSNWTNIMLAGLIGVFLVLIFAVAFKR